MNWEVWTAVVAAAVGVSANPAVLVEGARPSLFTDSEGEGSGSPAGMGRLFCSGGESWSNGRTDTK